ncbi:tandem-95 repeat protein, partial [Pseudomonas sp. NPDC088429]|uniref:tandem-95 repeat protein n=1 Tax=Pseudomonas sp. NPDC088429 TaxID=3364455 RepID=UPI00382B82C8
MDAVQNTQKSAPEAPSARQADAVPTAVYFIDRGVADADQLSASVPTGAEVHFIEQNVNGIQFIADTLQGRTNIDSVHIISHGEAGVLQVGYASLSQDSMQTTYHAQLAEIGRSLSVDGDILVYGCDFGFGDAGSAAVETLAEVTGADVAASTDDTGAASLGGDWDLERNRGSIEARNVDARDWNGLLVAPVLDATPNLTYTAVEDASAPTNGTNVGVLLSSYTGGITDVDPGALKGIAITANAPTQGVWWYTIDGGANWQAVGAVSNTSALLLADTASTRLYFQATTANFNGAVTGTALTFKAWDQSSGTVGAKASTTTGAGNVAAAVSTVTDTIAVSVSSVNDAPVLTDVVRSLTAFNEDVNIAAPVGAVGVDVTLAALNINNTNVSDVDTGAVKGIAIVGTNSVNGTWWYSTNSGTTWIQVGSVSEANALLLSNATTSRIYFQSTADYNGTMADALTIRAWDQTQGNNGGRFDIAGNGTGGMTAFSAATDVVAQTVTAVADIVANTATTLEDTSIIVDVLANDTFENAGRVISAIDGQAIAVNGSVTVTNGTVTLINDAGQQKLSFMPAADYSGTATFSYSVSSGGVAETANVTITITAVGDAPRIDLDSSTAGSNYTANYDQGGVYLGNLITVSDPENNNLTSMTVTLTGATVADRLWLSTAVTGITSSYNVATGVLTLTGNATLTVYQAALNNVLFESTSATTAPRTITFSAISGTVPTASNLATATLTPIDSDGDGVVNAADIDDDNDGILDTVENPGPRNVITNGDFSAGYAGFNSSIEDSMTGPYASSYETYNGVVDNGSTGGNYTATWNPFGGTGGAYLVTNDLPDVLGRPGAVVWNESLDVRPNQNLTFSFRMATTGVNLDVLVNGVSITGGIQYYGSSGWVNRNFAFNTGSSTAANIEIRQYSTSNSVNYPQRLDGDAGFDDMTLLVDYAGSDIDNDGTLDRLDLDADNDGITDNIEAQTTAGYIAPSGVDVDLDGLDDVYDAAVGDQTGAASIGLIPVDTDNDGTKDYIDSDSDNDGIGDIVERGDGQATSIISTNDTDHDGLLDIFEGSNVNDGFDPNDENIDTNHIYNLADSDNDTAADGSNAAPRGTDLDYRDDPQAPANNLPVAGWITPEDTAGQLTGISVIDNGANGTYIVQLTVDSGVLSATAGNGVTLTGVGTGTLTLSGTLGAVNAFLASASAPTYTPVVNYNGPVNLQIVTKDGGGAVGSFTDTDNATINVSPVNDAPVVDSSPMLSYTGQEDSGVPANGTAIGQLVSSFTSGISDIDAGAVKGIAVTATAPTNGVWWYTTDGGANWQAIGTVSNTSALLLADNANTRLYFQPTTANYNGTGGATALTFRGWDQTSGTAGTKVTTATNGGITAFSTATDTIAVTVAPVNDAPVMTDVVRSLTAFNEDVNISAPVGAVGVDVTLAALNINNTNVSDVDTGAVKGIAIVGTNSVNGIWWYSTNSGTTWLQVGSVSEANALLLSNATTSRIYFQSTADYNGTMADALTIRAWDQTQGTNGGRFDIAGNGTGGTTAFSAATDVVAQSVTAVADIVANTATTLEDTPIIVDVLANDTFENTGRMITAVDGQAITMNGSVNVTNGTVTMINDAGQQKLSFTPAADYSGTATFSYSVSSGGGVAETANVTITITAVGDAPRIDLDSSTAGSNYTANYDQGATPIGLAVSVTDPEGNNLTSMTITLINPTAADNLYLTASVTGITVTAFNPATGVMTLTGNSTLANYQRALNNIRFETTNGTPTSRTITVTAVSGTAPTASNVATATLTTIDTDGDGVANAADIDDDNDGILDTVEGVNLTIVSPSSGSASATPTAGWSIDETIDGIIAPNDGGNGYHANYTGQLDLVQYNFTKPQNDVQFIQFYNNVGNALADGQGVQSIGEIRIYAADGTVLRSITGYSNAGSIPDNSQPFQFYVGGLNGVARIEFHDLTAWSGQIGFSEVNILVGKDSDGDGVVNRLDLDSDDDGITDNIEAQTTAGYITPSGVDADGDGLDDIYDANVGNKTSAASVGLTPVDTDGDGVIDQLDSDSDADGVADIAERGDGQPSSVTLLSDTDGDGLLDIFEGSNVNDGYDANDQNIDGAGIFNLADTDNDTAANGQDALPMSNDLDYRDNPTLDVDNDHIIESIDIDDDNDGILDVLEYTQYPPADYVGPNYWGVPTLSGAVSAGGSLGELTDGSYSNTGLSIDPTGTAADYPDFILTIGGASGLPTGGLTVDSFVIANDNSATDGSGAGDGLQNVTIVLYDSIGNELGREVLTNLRTDHYLDTNPDYYTFSKTYFGVASFSVIAQSSYIYGPAAGNTTQIREIGLALRTAASAPRDTDGDGIFDHLDIDSDNDGITDNVEAQKTSTYVAPTGVDADADGLDDAYDANVGNKTSAVSVGLIPVNTDGDGLSDQIDFDSDADGITDIIERGDGQPTSVTSTTDTDHDGLLDIFEGSNANDGFDANDENIVAGTFNLADSDNDTAANGSDALSPFYDLDYRDTVAPKPPVVDLNSGVTPSEVVQNGSLTGSAGWSSPGAVPGFTANGWEAANPAVLTQSGIAGWNVGQAPSGAVQLTFNLAWDNNAGPPGRLTVSVGGVAYAVFDGSAGTGANDNTAVGIITFLNGSSGSPSTILTSVSGAYTTYRVTLNLPDNVAPTGDLTFAYNEPFGASDDAIRIDNISVLTTRRDIAADVSPGVDFATTYTEGSASISVADTDSSVHDDDNQTLQSASIVLTNAQAGDQLMILSSPPAGITALIEQSVPGQITVTLTGNASKAAYAEAIRGIGFRNTSDNPTTLNRIVHVTANDGTLNSAVATTTITLIPVNDLPVANDDALATNEGVALTFDPRLNDIDVENDALTITQIDGTAIISGGSVAVMGGIVTLNVDGTLTFTPSLGYVGMADFTYTVSDGNGGTDTARVDMTVVNLVDPPLTADDTNSVTENSTLNVNASAGLLANDVSSEPMLITQFTVDGSTFTAGDTAALAGIGTLTINADGSYSFTPAPEYIGAVPIATYTVSNGSDNATATLTLSIIPSNDPPIAGDDFSTVTEDLTLSVVAGSGLLSNDVDADGDPLVITDFVAEGVSYAAGITANMVGFGMLTINADGSYTFVPESNYAGPIPIITYTVSDGKGSTDTATLTLNMVAVEDSPASTSMPDRVRVDGENFDYDISSYFSDPDGDTLNYVISGLPPGRTYNPATGVISGTIAHDASQGGIGGAYTVTVTAYDGPDGTGLSTTQTFIVTVGNPVPTAVDDTATVIEDGALTVDAASGLIANDTDPDGDPMIVSLFAVAGDATVFFAGDTATINGVGTLTINSDGSYSFSPWANYSGAVPVVTYVVSDGNGGTDVATLTLTITPVNDVPKLVDPNLPGQIFDPATSNYAVTTPEDVAFSGQVAANDADSDTLAYSVATPPTNGTLTLDAATGAYTYIPTADYNGTDSFVVEISDGNGGIVQSVVTLTV